MRKSILILAGGGGHTSIALALAQAIKGMAETSFLIPKGDNLSRELLSPYGAVDELIKGRYPQTSNLTFPFRLASAFYHTLPKVNRKYDVVGQAGRIILAIEIMGKCSIFNIHPVQASAVCAHP